MWFEQLTGFREEGVEDVAAQFVVDGEWITSIANGRTMRHGQFGTPSLVDFRAQPAEPPTNPGRLRLRETVGDVQTLHTDPANAGALFQVASQFNTLEMISPSITPDHGIDRYETDHTQGPACAICCGAGTIYRNYLVPIDGHTVTQAFCSALPIAYASHPATSWEPFARLVLDALQRALDLHADTGLDVTIVSYSTTNPALRDLLDQHGS